MIALPKIVALALTSLVILRSASDQGSAVHPWEQQILRSAQDDRADLPTLDRWLRRLADSAGFSGVVLVERGGKVILDRAYQRAGKPKITTQSAFWLASTTKQFTAAAILKLVDQGKLAVTDSIDHFFRGLPRETRTITVEQLLTHTSGIAASSAADGVVDRDAAVRAILDEPLRRPPGDSYHYEDEDYTVLAAIVEVVSGMPFDSFVERDLLIPAGLTRTATCGRLAPGIPVAASSGGPAIPRPCQGGITPIDWADRGATGLVGTASDLLKWTHALRGGKVVSRQAIRDLERGKILVRREGETDVYYSFGARIYMQGNNRREVWLSGYDVRVGHSSTIRILDSGLTVVVLSNSGLDARGNPWASTVARGVDDCLSTAGCRRPLLTTNASGQ